MLKQWRCIQIENHRDIPVIEAVKLCKQYGVSWRASTTQQYISRGVLKGQKLNGYFTLTKLTF